MNHLPRDKIIRMTALELERYKERLYDELTRVEIQLEQRRSENDI
jgi:hypothetical protein